MAPAVDELGAWMDELGQLVLAARAMVDSAAARVPLSPEDQRLLGLLENSLRELTVAITFALEPDAGAAVRRIFGERLGGAA